MWTASFNPPRRHEDPVNRECDELNRNSKPAWGFLCRTLAIMALAAPTALMPSAVRGDDAEGTKTAPAATDAARDADPGADRETAVSFTGSRIETDHGTRIKVPDAMASIHRRGGVPASLALLRVMETQQRAVAERVEECTVSVRIGQAQGCGVIVNEKGDILTAAHVATRPGSDAIVTLHDGRQLRAVTLGMNRDVDAGLIRILEDQNQGKPFPHASLGTSRDLVPGMWCIAMGHPGGYDAARGAVVRVGRLLDVAPNVVVSDCALIGGDSGGPLFNFAGELIAIHSRIGNDVADNLHVPIHLYDSSWNRMSDGLAWGTLPNFTPTIGVRGSSGTPNAEILAVTSGSPAEKSGLRIGDVVVRFGEKTITDFQSLIDAVADTMPGEPVSIAIKRGSRTISIRLVIGRSSKE